MTDSDPQVHIICALCDADGKILGKWLPQSALGMSTESGCKAHTEWCVYDVADNHTDPQFSAYGSTGNSFRRTPRPGSTRAGMSNSRQNHPTNRHHTSEKDTTMTDSNASLRLATAEIRTRLSEALGEVNKYDWGLSPREGTRLTNLVKMTLEAINQNPIRKPGGAAGPEQNSFIETFKLDYSAPYEHGRGGYDLWTHPVGIHLGGDLADIIMWLDENDINVVAQMHEGKVWTFDFVLDAEEVQVTWAKGGIEMETFPMLAKPAEK